MMSCNISSLAASDSGGDGNGDDDVDTSKRKSLLPPETVEHLKKWIMSPEHVGYPYPTEQEKADIMEETGIELKQLNNWFVNNRKRYWKHRVEALRPTEHMANVKDSNGKKTRTGEPTKDLPCDGGSGGSTNREKTEEKCALGTRPTYHQIPSEKQNNEKPRDNSFRNPPVLADHNPPMVPVPQRVAAAARRRRTMVSDGGSTDSNASHGIDPLCPSSMATVATPAKQEHPLQPLFSPSVQKILGRVGFAVDEERDRRSSNDEEESGKPKGWRPAKVMDPYQDEDTAFPSPSVANAVSQYLSDAQHHLHQTGQPFSSILVFFYELGWTRLLASTSFVAFVQASPCMLNYAKAAQRKRDSGAKLSAPELAQIRAMDTLERERTLEENADAPATSDNERNQQEVEDLTRSLQESKATNEYLEQELSRVQQELHQALQQESCADSKSHKNVPSNNMKQSNVKKEEEAEDNIARIIQSLQDENIRLAQVHSKQMNSKEREISKLTSRLKAQAEKATEKDQEMAKLKRQAKKDIAARKAGDKEIAKLQSKLAAREARLNELKERIKASRRTVSKRKAPPSASANMVKRDESSCSRKRHKKGTATTEAEASAENPAENPAADSTTDGNVIAETVSSASGLRASQHQYGRPNWGVWPSDVDNTTKAEGQPHKGDTREERKEMGDPAVAKAALQKFPVGTLLRKTFGKKGAFQGQVIGHTGHFYKVRYEDGDYEEMTLQQLKYYTREQQKSDSSNGRPAEESLIGPPILSKVVDL